MKIKIDWWGAASALLLVGMMVFVHLMLRRLGL